MVMPVSASEDGEQPVSIGIRAARSGGKYQYLRLYRVKFAVPETPLSTKADEIELDPATHHGLCQHIDIAPNGSATVVFEDSTQNDTL